MQTVPFTHAGRPGSIDIHQGHAFVRWAGMGFQADAATGPLREVIRRTISGAVSIEPLSLDTALEAGAEYLERSSYFADRYQLADGASAYFCRDCGCEIEDADDGCEHCGAGLEDNEDD
jgi:hypothetical protein